MHHPLLFLSLLLGLLPCSTAGIAMTPETGSSPEALPAYDALVDLVRTHLPGLSEAELNRASVLGLLDRLKHRVWLENAAPAEASSAVATNLVTQARVFEKTYGYVRIESVAPGLSGQVGNAIQTLAPEEPLRGLIIDLRFSHGTSYEEAVETAGLFISQARPLLTWQNRQFHSQANEEAFAEPLMLLVNGGTSSAAEALAAVLRDTRSALVVGSTTAGEALEVKTIPLGNGMRLKIAGEPLKTAGGFVLSAEGIRPDIPIEVFPEHELFFREDPFADLSRLAPQDLPGDAKANLFSLLPAHDSLDPVDSPPTRTRMNESDLIRMLRDSPEPEGGSAAAGERPVAAPAVRDPALGRALDLLKGLNLMKKPR